jgi:hypothetical protein
MKRAVKGERDRADRPVGAVDVKLAVHGGRSELMLAAGLRAAACHPVVPESSKKSISPSAAHGLLAPSAHQAGHARMGTYLLGKFRLSAETEKYLAAIRWKTVRLVA